MISLYFNHLVNFPDCDDSYEETSGSTEEEHSPYRHEGPTKIYYDAAQPRYVHLEDEVYGLVDEEEDG